MTNFEAPDQTGKAPEHRAAALRGQTSEIMRTPMAKSATPIVQGFKKSTEEIHRIYEECKIKTKKLEKEKYDEGWKFTEKIRDLESQKHALERKYDEAIKEVERQADEKAKTQRDIVENAREYKLLLDVPEVPDITDDTISQYKPERVLKWGNIIYSDPYVKLRYLIAQNDKPTNKYSLMVIGIVGFGVHEELFTQYRFKPKNFSKFGHTHLNNNVLRAKIEAITRFNPYHLILDEEVKTFPTLHSAEEYMEKHPHILGEMISYLQEKEKKLKEVKESFTASDFEGIKERD